MGRIFFIIVFLVLFLLNIGCSSLSGSEFELVKKYPSDLPNLGVSFLNDSSAIFFKTEDKSIIQNINFSKMKKHFLIVSYIEKKNNLISFEKGDTIVLYKKELWVINEKHKLVFLKIN